MFRLSLSELASELEPVSNVALIWESYSASVGETVVVDEMGRAPVCVVKRHRADRQANAFNLHFRERPLLAALLLASLYCGSSPHCLEFIFV